MVLESLGFRPEVGCALSALGDEGLRCARVMRAERGVVWALREAQGEEGPELSEARLVLPRRLHAGDGAPVAGDWVAYREDTGAVVRVLPRLSAFVRRKVGRAEAVQVLAANVDEVVVVMALDADFSVRRLSRYLALARGSGIAVRVLLTKAAACEDVAARVDEVVVAAGGAPVAAVDVIAGLGLEAVDALATPGKTLVFVGLVRGRQIDAREPPRRAGGGGRAPRARERRDGGSTRPRAVRCTSSPEVGSCSTPRGCVRSRSSGTPRRSTRCSRTWPRTHAHAGSATALTRGSRGARWLQRSTWASSTVGVSTSPRALRDELSRTERRRAEKARGKRMAVALREVLRVKGRWDP
jgi:hypothetical protein